MRHVDAMKSSLYFALSLALICASALPALAQNAAVSSAPMLQGGVTRTGVANSAGGGDVLVGTVIVTKNPHVHFTSHRDFVSGRVYEPGPTPQDYANAVNSGISIFNSVMGIVDSCGGFSGGGSSSSGGYSSGGGYSSSGGYSSGGGCSSGH